MDTDTIHKCLSSIPVPCLQPAFSAFKSIWSDVKQAQVGKEELEALALNVAQLLQTLDAEYRERRLLEAGTMASLANLSRCVSFPSDVYIYLNVHLHYAGC